MRRTILTILFILGIFICMLDTTILNVSLPNIGEHLDVGLDSLSWALNVYLILFASLTILLTRISEMLGVHKCFLIGVFLFGIGSTLSALSSELSMLLVGRAIQSVGASIVFPLSMTLGIGLVNVEKRTGMIAILGITQGLAAALGPTIGGIVTQFMGWRWIFWINVPLTIIMILIGITNLNMRNEVQHKQSMDILGAILIMVTLATVSLGMMQGRVWTWTSFATVLCFLTSAVSFSLFVWIEHRSKNPMVPLQLFSDRNFSVSSGVIIFSNLFLVAATVILPSYFTNIAGFDSFHSSLLISPISLAILIFSPISGFAQARVNAKWLILIGFIVMASGYMWLAFGALMSQMQTILAGFAIGMGYGIITGPILIIAAGSLEGKLLAASQSVTGVLRQVGSMLAVAIFVTGLYSNLSVAKTASKTYAHHQIMKLHLPDKEQENVINKINTNTNTTKFVKANINDVPIILKHSIQNIENNTNIELRKSFENLYLASLPFLLLSAIIGFFLKSKK